MLKNDDSRVVSRIFKFIITVIVQFPQFLELFMKAGVMDKIRKIMSDKNANFRLKTCEYLVKMIKNKEISNVILNEFSQYRVDEHNNEKFYGLLLELIDIA